MASAVLPFQSLVGGLPSRSAWKVTHVQRVDGGGFDYLKLWVSGQKVSAGHTVGSPSFTLTLMPDGHLEGKWPGGYQYAWIIAGKRH